MQGQHLGARRRWRQGDPQLGQDEAALPGVAKRGLGVVSRSMLRANVKTIDLAKRDFKDKDEWKKVLKVLQEAGKLTYDAVNDSISLPA